MIGKINLSKLSAFLSQALALLIWYLYDWKIALLVWGISVFNSLHAVMFIYDKKDELYELARKNQTNRPD
jgi:hypothetical protein